VWVKAMSEKNNISIYILAGIIVSGFFALLGLLLFHPLPPDSSGVIFMLFGALSAAFGAVVQYFFGSSKGSADKTELLNKASQPTPPKG
jgi:drug/metabolite transporter (DMT)-like permease